MSEPANVRLVRCPKCENLLPEVTDYSVYQCGACGAVLRAKNNTVEADSFSEKSDEERIRGVSEKFSEKSENFVLLDKRMVRREVFSDGSENDCKSNGSSSRSEKRKDSVIRADKWGVENDLEINKNIDEFGHAKMSKEFENLRLQQGNATGSGRRMSDWRFGERGEMEGMRRTERFDVEDVRYSSSKYPEESPSNYQLQLGSSYGYDEPEKNRNDSSGFNKVEYYEQDRAELLKRIDELKDQISRSCNVADKPQEKVPPDRRIVHQDPYSGSEYWIPDVSLGLKRASMQYPAADKHVARPPYISPYAEPSPFSSKQEMLMHNFYPPIHRSYQSQGFGDPFRSHMPRRVPLQAPGPFQQQPPHPYYSGLYMDNDMVQKDPYETYPPDMNPHHPSCSCFHCYNKYHQVPPPVRTTGFYDKRVSTVPNDPMFSHHEHLGAFGPQHCNSKISNPPPFNNPNPQFHTRWSSDVNSEVGGFVHRRPPRVVAAPGVRHCRPIAGAAPFVACCNCFELLEMPKKVLLMGKIQKEMRCGACSTVILYEVTNKRLLVSVAGEAKKTFAEVDNSSNVVKKDGNSHNHGHLTGASMNFSSEDYDNSGCDYQSMDRELVSSSTAQGFNSNKSAEMKSLLATPSCTSDDEDDPESLTAARKNAISAELPIKVDASPPAAGSPLQDHFDYSTKYHRSGKGNVSGRSEQEKEMPKRVVSWQNSMKDSSLATEIDISSNEYSNTGTSQDSSEVSRGEGQLRANKRAESFFGGIIKKGFRDSSKSSQTDEEDSTNVTVNGHPIPERLIKKAEKLAGQIHPGQYWYDSRAGFWGVMGGPCLGIIPRASPKDLNLLGSRGLPTDGDRSYIVEISGRVLDEDSGEELESLGKLAPT
ncbi:unnamed protein product [Ilex paraguariensis]|uniref:Zinc-ribbon domain-containing protein n=1 Tax=Ilex paraguariensis TaxID=185542 RepID=A0ABC8RNH9_9AQUA